LFSKEPVRPLLPAPDFTPARQFLPEKLLDAGGLGKYPSPDSGNERSASREAPDKLREGIASAIPALAAEQNILLYRPRVFLLLRRGDDAADAPDSL
jgi:hypothetical protein